MLLVKISKFILIAVLAALISIFLSDSYISSYSKQTFDEIDALEAYEVGLVLGTSKYTRSGHKNLFYAYRLQSALELYHAGKIRRIIVSGDNATQAYNEPRMMYQDLVAGGVAAADIYMDFAGFRTLDSVVRAKKIFNQNRILIISQQFHNERALFIADQHNMEAAAYNAPSVSYSFAPKTYLREKLARCKALIDIYILNKKP